MARRRKAQAPAADPTRPSTAQPEISEAEQWRIIQETGLLQQLQTQPEPQAQTVTVEDDDEGTPLADELLDALFIITPFCFLLTLMEV
jgi:hypothetical protein